MKATLLLVSMIGNFSTTVDFSTYQACHIALYGQQSRATYAESGFTHGGCFDKYTTLANSDQVGYNRNRMIALEPPPPPVCGGDGPAIVCQ